MMKVENVVFLFSDLDISGRLISVCTENVHPREIEHFTQTARLLLKGFTFLGETLSPNKF